MSQWFRWYEGTCEDGKFRMVARNASVTVATVMGVWAALLEDAAHDDHRGIATRGEDYYTAILDLEGQVLQAILEQMDKINLIACCTNDTIEITRWKERQYETDSTDPTNADRQRRFREKHKEKQKENASVTARNGNVTATKRPETETETETEKNISTVARATRRNEHFDQFWKAYPAREGANPKAPAEKLFLAAVKAGADPEDIVRGARACASRESKNIGTPFIPQAVKWLRDKRWLDYLEPIPSEAPVDWDAFCLSYKKFGFWSKHAPGNEPGLTGCLCPPEILAKHGIGAGETVFIPKMRVVQ
jgi:hypothetical protein